MLTMVAYLYEHYLRSEHLPALLHHLLMYDYEQADYVYEQVNRVCDSVSNVCGSV